jgi:branched-chain amino acid transport system ATP-binding protein
MNAPLLELKGVSVSYGPVRALEGLALRVEEASIVCLIGANGAGKSSTLRAISGLSPCEGSIRFKGEELGPLATHERVRRGLVHCPEGRGVLPDLSVEENLALGACVRTDTKSVRRDLERVLALFPRLKERLRQGSGTLSGGEQQMLAVGRALMSEPRLLMLDEPSLGLAPQVAELILETVETIRAGGVGVLLVEQNASAALEIGQYAYVLENGRLALEGSAAEIADHPAVRTAYLGH